MKKKSAKNLQKKSKDPYKNKFFYEIELSKELNRVMLVGPLDNIFFTVSQKNTKNNYPYAQVIDGKLVNFFKKEEILVTNFKLGK
jgi:hypothetical protein